MAIKINAEGLHYKDLNHLVSSANDKEVVIENALGHRYIGTGAIDKDIKIHGITGNALGAYLNAIPMNAIGFFGLHIITAGSYDGEAFVETDGEKNYKKLVTKDNELKGFILMGDVKRAGIYTSLIMQHIAVDECDFELLKKAPQMMAFTRERRNEKLAGGVGNGN